MREMMMIMKTQLCSKKWVISIHRRKIFYPSHYKYFIVEGISRTHPNKGNI